MHDDYHLHYVETSEKKPYMCVQLSKSATIQIAHFWVYRLSKTCDIFLLNPNRSLIPPYPCWKKESLPPFTRKKHVLSHCCCAEEKTLKHTTKTLKKTYEAPKKEERIHFIHFCPFDVTYTIIVNAHEKKTNVIKIWWCRNDGIILSLF